MRNSLRKEYALEIRFDISSGANKTKMMKPFQVKHMKRHELGGEYYI